MWYRIRYDDQGRDLRPALRFLEWVAQHGLELLWLRLHGQLLLLARAAQEHEAVLLEGLLNVLPEARLLPETGDIGAVLRELTQRYGVWGPLPSVAPLPDLLAQLPSDSAVWLTWRKGKLSLPQLYTRERRETVQRALTEVWPGARLWPAVATPPLWEGAPVQLLHLPPVSQHITLAARNVQEQPFRQAHTGDLVLGSTNTDQPVGVAAPLRLVWVGAPAWVGQVAAWLTQRWRGRVVVLDASGEVTKDWQDVSRAGAYVAWSAVGKSTHVNPLTRLPDDGLEVYVQRILDWLAALGITEAVLGRRIEGLLRALLTLQATETRELNPLHVLQLCSTPEVVDGLAERAAEVLTASDLAVWQGRNWVRDAAWLTPAVNVLRSLFDQTPELALWYPPYTAEATLQTAPWSVWRVPAQQRGQRAYWAGMWPLLRQLYGQPETLIVALGLGLYGKTALTLAETGASVLVWGRTLRDAVGDAGSETLHACDLLLGAGADASLARLVNVAPAIIAAQADDQATARLRGDVGSVRLRYPQRAAAAERGWRAEGATLLPSLLTVIGDEASARAAVLRLVGGKSGRVLVVGNQALWPELRAQHPAALFLPLTELPMLNPLAPRPKNAHPWVWWGRGLGLSETVMQGAYREGAVDSLQGLLHYVESLQLGNGTATALRDAVRSGLFAAAESDPRAWFAAASLVAVESTHPALTRMLVMAALEARAAVVVWNAPGLAASDVPLLRQAQSLVYPDKVWISDLLVTRVTDAAIAVLPERLQELAPQLSAREAYWFRRGQHSFSKVLLP